MISMCSYIYTQSSDNVNLWLLLTHFMLISLKFSHFQILEVKFNLLFIRLFYKSPLNFNLSISRSYILINRLLCSLFKRNLVFLYRVKYLYFYRSKPFLKGPLMFYMRLIIVQINHELFIYLLGFFIYLGEILQLIFYNVF